MAEALDPTLMTDDELREALLKYYPNVAPVVDATRNTLRNLLVRTIEEGGPATAAGGTETPSPPAKTPRSRDGAKLSVSFAPYDDVANFTQDEELEDELNQTASELTEAAIEDADLSPTSRRRIRHITVEEELPASDNFFAKALISGVMVVIAAVAALWLLRWATDY